jgi:mercuric ion binding protein
MFKNMLQKLIIICSFAFFINISSVSAREINIDVNGLVCEFCAATIEKSFKKKQEVQNIKVDLEQKKVFLTFKEGKDLPDNIITDTIVNNGYNVVRINRKKND